MASGLHFLFARYTLHTSIHPHTFSTLISSLHSFKQQNELLFQGTVMLPSPSLLSAHQIKTEKTFGSLNFLGNKTQCSSFFICACRKWESNFTLLPIALQQNKIFESKKVNKSGIAVWRTVDSSARAPPTRAPPLSFRRTANGNISNCREGLLNCTPCEGTDTRAERDGDNQPTKRTTMKRVALKWKEVQTKNQSSGKQQKQSCK